MAVIDEYIKSFDHVRGVWAKKQEAASFGDFLAHELQLNRKGILVEPDGRTYRIYIPLLSKYWHPAAGEPWSDHLEYMRDSRRAVWTDQ